MEPARLEGMPLFAELNDEERAEVAARTREVTVEKGETVAMQGTTLTNSSSSRPVRPRYARAVR